MHEKTIRRMGRLCQTHTYEDATTTSTSNTSQQHKGTTNNNTKVDSFKAMFVCYELNRSESTTREGRRIERAWRSRKQASEDRMKPRGGEQIGKQCKSKQVNSGRVDSNRSGVSR
ncbi:hypothetical protein Pmani_030252 [Petrolisthes manimaculis]|uniref:Uncharacterized protein n=1 Tax=Petrolisthes manimaculis TaxID=1843537 RepID=A0AAE1TTN2_9EUCA|nr:hypothetical protein Pmani_030252 [Petrolisthes manimaculis]